MQKCLVIIILFLATRAVMADEPISLRPAELVVLDFVAGKDLPSSLNWMGGSMGEKLRYYIRQNFEYSDACQADSQQLAESKVLQGSSMREVDILDIAISCGSDIIIYGTYKKTVNFINLPLIPNILPDLVIELKIFDRNKNGVVWKKQFLGRAESFMQDGFAGMAAELKDALADYLLNNTSLYNLSLGSLEETRYLVSVIKTEAADELSPFFEKVWQASLLTNWLTMNSSEVRNIDFNMSFYAVSYQPYFNPDNKLEELLSRHRYLDQRYKYTVFGTDFSQVINLYFLVYGFASLIDVSLFINDIRFLYLTLNSDTLNTLDELNYISHKESTINHMRLVYSFWVQRPF